MLNLSQSCIILNKPAGISSNDALTKVKKKLNQKKAGYSGTLDPLASGVLIIFFNKATKLCSYFLNSDKTYNAIAEFGKTSDTGDLGGNIINHNTSINLKNINLKILEDKYTGIVEQIPPMYSALKHKGIPLYKYARKGISLKRNPRNIKINSIKLRLLDSTHMSLYVSCSKGTYIRTLVEQLGEEIGSGALVSKLERIRINNISIDKSIGLNDLLQKPNDDIINNDLINVDQLLDNVDSFRISNCDKIKILNGNKLDVRHSPCEIIKIYDEDDNFLGIGSIRNLELFPKKILA